jgi:hypothetical protein
VFKNTYIPTTIVDGFLDDPNALREYALKQNYTKDTEGRWPGVRSLCLSKISPILYHHICQKTLSLLYTNNQPYRYEADIFFQIINNDYESGWVHKDPSLITTVLYLTPGLNSGTSLYLKKNVDFNDSTYIQDKIDSYLSGMYNINSRNLNNQQYEETVIVKGLYNRLIVFDSNIYHAAHDYFGSNKEDSRLTLVSFFRVLYGDLETPLNRCKNHTGHTTL